MAALQQAGNIRKHTGAKTAQCVAYLHAVEPPRGAAARAHRPRQSGSSVRRPRAQPAPRERGMPQRHRTPLKACESLRSAQARPTRVRCREAFALTRCSGCGAERLRGRLEQAGKLCALVSTKRSAREMVQSYRRSFREAAGGRAAIATKDGGGRRASPPARDAPRPYRGTCVYMDRAVAHVAAGACSCGLV